MKNCLDLRCGARMLAAAAFGVCSAGSGWAFAQNCPPDGDGDGHPLFPHTVERADWNEYPVAVTGFDLGDLNGDGYIDFVGAGSARHVHRTEKSFVTVLLSRGDGVFEPAVGYEAGLEATAVRLADVDGDGHLDAVVANAFDDTVSVFPGVGDGTFGPRVDVAVGDEPRAVVVADFNGDGFPDAATINTMTFDASILLNDGQGNLVLHQSVPIPGLTPRGLAHRGFPYPGPWHAAGDIDGDGDTDLAVPAQNGIRFLINDGAGNFELSPGILPAPNPMAYALALEDLNGNGHLDLAAVSSGGAESWMDVWHNDGAGGFSHVGSYNSSFRQLGVWRNTGLAFGDVDGDGFPDAAIATENGAGAVIHRNLGDGTFGPMEVLVNVWAPWAVSLSDVNGDGAVDHLSLSSDLGSSLHVKLNDGEGELQTVEPVLLPPGTVARFYKGRSADMTGDGHLDAVYLGIGTEPDVRVLANDGTGLFEVVFSADVNSDIPPFVENLSLLDLDDDGALDILLAVNLDAQNHNNPGALQAFVNDGRGEFTLGLDLRFDDFLPLALEAGDFNGDGHWDVAAWGITPRNPDLPFAPVDRRVIILLNDGSGGLSISGDYMLANLYPVRPLGDIEAVDLNGDGHLDLIATATAFDQSASIFVLLNDGNGAFAIHQELPVDLDAYSLAVGDWDGDGVMDAAVMHELERPGRPYLTILENDGAGTLSIGRRYFHPNARFEQAGFIAADVNEDSATDLVLAWNGVAGLMVHLNDRQGGFDSAASYSLADWTYTPLAGDFDGDGVIDLLVARAGLDPLMLLRGVRCACRADLDGDGATTPADFLLYLDLFAAADPRADFTGDGAIDATDFFAYLDAFAAGCD